jgi:xanthine dehydrogenase accessory factor
MLVVTDEGSMIGSVSGGCVESSVLKKCQEAMENGHSSMEKYGVSNEDAWEVGLSCGGALDIWIEPVVGLNNRKIWAKLSGKVIEKQPAVLVRNLEITDQSGVYSEGHFHGFNFENPIGDVAIQSLSDRNCQWVDKQYFVQPFSSRKKMILIGSAHITVDLIVLASQFDFETIVIDPRDTFAKKTTYIQRPDEMHICWPQEILSKMILDMDTYAVILSHDPKIDDEALKILLKSNIRYIGALGSKKTHAKRKERLLEYGFNESEIGKINAPIGLDISARLPSEIALSVMAEVVKFSNS